jgi:hypothetical protein
VWLALDRPNLVPRALFPSEREGREKALVSGGGFWHFIGPLKFDKICGVRIMYAIFCISNFNKNGGRHGGEINPQKDISLKSSLSALWQCKRDSAHASNIQQKR